ncbi:protein quiver [Caerostris darwini]|uniref:Protein quiver n=1 Tax=Caerostris darwini TaxID=1538125 RepID=A0AAV4TC48_9ARAC|nr:protein quiver [Caerostris darwini]
MINPSRIRRCYSCRSRGELGDCKDPFEYNATVIDDIKGVEATPCASGWCAKIIEGETDDFDTATERMCVQRPPADGEEVFGHNN